MITNINEILEKELTKLVNKAVCELLDKFHCRLEENQKSLTTLMEDSKEISNRLVIKVVESFGKSVDMIYSRDIRNKKEVEITHGHKHKRILSDIGEINFDRKRYVVNGEPFYVVDDFLMLDKRQRIEKGYQSNILKLSAETSYNKAAKLLNNDITPRTALNIARRSYLQTMDKMNDVKEMRYVDKVFIEADEDHIHLKDGTSGIMKLVYVHEGYYYDSILKKRVLINPRYFSTNKSSRYIWAQVKEYVKKRYYPGTPISISGDGAFWIKQSFKFFPNAKFNLDRFHVYQTIVRLTKGRKDKMKEYLKAIRDKDYEFFKKKYYERFKKDAKVDKSSGNMYGILYLLNNLENIDLDSIDICCSAESHVSNVLSARMSSRPMAWSKEGANVMAGYRAYQASNFDFKKIFNSSNFGLDKNSTKSNTKSNEGNSADRGSLARIQTSNSILGVEGLQDQISESLKKVLSKCKAAFSRIL